jgi:hypothetical protein
MRGSTFVRTTTVRYRGVGGVLAVALLLVLAGCSTSPGVGSQTPGVSEGAPSSANVTYPAGTNASTVTNLSALLSAHYTVLEGADYRLTVRYRGPNRTTNSTVWSSRSAGRQLIWHHRTNRSSGLARHRGYFLEDGQQAQRLRSSESKPRGFVVDRSDRPFRDHHLTSVVYVVPMWGDPRIPLLTGPLERARVEHRGDHRFVTYRPPPEADGTVNGSVTVRDDGLLRTIRVRGDRGDGRYRFTMEYDLSTGLSVRKPSWADITPEPDRGFGGGDRDCDDFDSQAAAQSYHEEVGGSGLDGDGDGVACEALP